MTECSVYGYSEADEANPGDLLFWSLDDLEGIAAKQGGIWVLLDEKWQDLPGKCTA